jgi:DNA-binding NarL/FixJ family response regulator
VNILQAGMINLLIVEDDDLLRDLLKISLDSRMDLGLVGAVSDGETAIEYADRFNPDVVLMDIELGSEPNGIAAGKAIKEAHEETGMIIFSAHNRLEYVNLITTEGFAGWSYILKQSVSDIGILVRAIEGAASGFVAVDPTVVNDLEPRKGSLTAGLTPQLQEILMMMAQGYKNEAIGEKLGLDTRTVDKHINAIIRGLTLGHSGPLQPRVRAVLSYINDSTWL